MEGQAITSSAPGLAHVRAQRRERIAERVFVALAAFPQQLTGGPRAEAQVAADVAFEWADAFIERADREE